MIPEETFQRWAAKVEELRQLRDDLELPYPSGTALAMAGHYPYPELIETLSAVAQRFPDELPMDGGTARSKEIEKTWANRAEARGLKALESVWLATDLALYFRRSEHQPDHPLELVRHYRSPYEAGPEILAGDG